MITISKLSNLSKKNLEIIKNKLIEVNGRLKLKLNYEDVLKFIERVDAVKIASGTIHSRSIKYDIKFFYNGESMHIPESYKYSKEFTQVVIHYNGYNGKFNVKIKRGTLYPGKYISEYKIYVTDKGEYSKDLSEYLMMKF